MLGGTPGSRCERRAFPDLAPLVLPRGSTRRIPPRLQRDRRPGPHYPSRERFAEKRASGSQPRRVARRSRSRPRANAPLAECRARTEACNNARLPMQTRFGRSGIAAPPAEPTAWSPTIRMSPLQSPGPVPPENKAVVLIPAGTLSRLGESSSEANLLLPRRWSKQRHPAECADALLRVGQTSGLRCCRFASRSDRLRPRNSVAAGCRPSELCGPPHNRSM